MDGFQLGDQAFNQPTNQKKKKPISFAQESNVYVYVGMTFHALSLTPEFAACFRCKNQPVILSNELLCSFMSYGYFSYEFFFIFICEIPRAPEILKETTYSGKHGGWIFPRVADMTKRLKAHFHAEILALWL